jgi:hypothetical protein
MAADFTYRFDGMFYTVYPENSQAEALYNLNAATGWHGNMLSAEFAVFRRDLRRTGWSLRKAPKIRKSDARDPALLASLGL